ncbi:hypothetical protein [Cryptosporangium sp. NPDC051539]|uniref:hypothetical protein n=1 Tax=Cryptosporangium sp. NPDC051539 TaxID=3363962 RepID=UPI0037BDDB65
MEPRRINPVVGVLLLLFGPADYPGNPLWGTQFDPRYREYLRASRRQRRRR